MNFLVLHNYFSKILQLMLPWSMPLLSGALLVFSLPGIGIPIFTVLAFVPLLYEIRNQKLSLSFAILTSFLLCFPYQIFHTWLALGDVTKGGGLILYSMLSTLLLSSGIIFLLTRPILSIYRVIFFPFAWVIGELLRNIVLSDIGWSSAGGWLLGFTFTQTLSILTKSLLAYIPVSCAVLIVLVDSLMRVSKGTQRKNLLGYTAGVLCSMFFLIILGGLLRTSHTVVPQSTRVSVINHTVIPKESIRSSLGEYLEGVRGGITANSRLTILPPVLSAYPSPWFEEASLFTISKSNHAVLLGGRKNNKPIAILLSDGKGEEISGNNVSVRLDGGILVNVSEVLHTPAFALLDDSHSGRRIPLRAEFAQMFAIKKKAFVFVSTVGGEGLIIAPSGDILKKTKSTERISADIDRY